MNGTCYSIEVRPVIPAQLGRLEELANDLFYSWSTEVRALFYYLHPDLWIKCGHNPRLFLRRVSQHRLDEAAKDPTFLKSYHLALAEYDDYLNEPARVNNREWLDPVNDLIAYFSMEYGFHESVPIYSGGLGILAADHCKAASDLAVPLVAIGLLYRQGYFNQSIDAHGNQVAVFNDTELGSLPIEPVTDAQGEELRVCIQELADPVHLRLWRAKAGRIRLYLLDSDVVENSGTNRTITHQLYGGDNNTRIIQEMVLGIGGVRALRALGLQPSAWHINEGHGAFQIIERCRELVSAKLPFDVALESVAAATVFTTHTPVQAGHDTFSPGLISMHMGGFASGLGLSNDQFFDLGASPTAPQGFNMTALALRGSRFHNGVSRIHGEVASKMEAYIWPQIDAQENPMGYVTNGVHLYTFLAPQWKNLFDLELGHEWRNRLINDSYWEAIDGIADASYWNIRQTLKSQLLKYMAGKVRAQCQRNGCSSVDTERTLKHLNPANTNTLIVGFARRFATYKRANLIFHDLDRLARLVNDPDRPISFVFAGKAHPQDTPGQQLINYIHRLSQERRFQGKIVLLENYNMAMARRLVTGVDVWLNTPEYPMEASGTSGQKAGLNGVVNLSVLDGWWGEGYDGNNGWAIQPHPSGQAGDRDVVESQTIMDVLEHAVVPAYFNQEGSGYSQEWIRISKASMKTILPKYNSQRMVMDYVRHYYSPAIRQGKRIDADQYSGAVALAQWKAEVRRRWSQVRLRRLDEPLASIGTSDTFSIRVGVEMNGLRGEDIVVECLIGRISDGGELSVSETVPLIPQDAPDNSGEMVYGIDLKPKLGGLQHYQLRAYPAHPLLTHRFELGCMIWL